MSLSLETRCEDFVKGLLLLDENIKLVELNTPGLQDLVEAYYEAPPDDRRAFMYWIMDSKVRVILEEMTPDSSTREATLYHSIWRLLRVTS